MGDYLDAFFAHEAEAERWLNRRPVCSICGEHIQDERAVHMANGDWICDECIDDMKEYIEEDEDYGKL